MNPGLFKRSFPHAIGLCILNIPAVDISRDNASILLSLYFSWTKGSLDYVKIKYMEGHFVLQNVIESDNYGTSEISYFRESNFTYLSENMHESY